VAIFFAVGCSRPQIHLVTRDADVWHRRMSRAGLPVTEIVDRPWGMREFTLHDSSGNAIGIGRTAD